MFIRRSENGVPITAKLGVEDASIVFSTLFWVAKYLVGFGDLGKTACGIFRSVILVGVEFARQATISRLYFGAGRILRDPQNLVIIRHLLTLGEHGSVFTAWGRTPTQ